MIKSYAWRKAIENFDFGASFETAQVVELAKALDHSSISGSQNDDKYKLQINGEIGPPIRANNDQQEQELVKSKLLTSDNIGRDSPKVELQNVLEFERQSSQISIDKEETGVKRAERRVKQLNQRLWNFRQLMVLIYTAKSIMEADQKLKFQTNIELITSLIEGKVQWIAELIGKHDRFCTTAEGLDREYSQFKESISEDTINEENLKMLFSEETVLQISTRIVGLRGSKAITDMFCSLPKEEQVELADKMSTFMDYVESKSDSLNQAQLTSRVKQKSLTETEVVLAQIAYETVKELCGNAKTRPIPLPKVLRKLRKSESLQVAVNKDLFTPVMKLKLIKSAKSLMPPIDDIVDEKTAQDFILVSIHIAAFTRDATHLLRIMGLLCRDDLMTPNFAKSLMRELSHYPSIWDDTKQSNAIYDSLVKDYVRLATELRQDIAEESYRRHYGIGEMQEDRSDAVEEFEKTTWVNFFANILRYQIKRQVDILKRALPSERFLHADFSINCTDPAFFDSLKVAFKAVLQLSERETIQALTALAYLNLEALRINQMANVSFDAELMDQLRSNVPDTYKNLFGESESLYENLATEFQLDHKPLDAFLANLCSQKPIDDLDSEQVIKPISPITINTGVLQTQTVDVSQIDLTQPLSICHAILKAGFLEDWPDQGLLEGTITALLTRLQKEEMLQSTAVRLVLYAAISHDKLFASSSIESALRDLYMSRSADVENEVRNDLVRYLILTQVKRLLKPIDASDDIELGELFSGGLEPQYFHFFDTNHLVSMLADAKLGLDTQLCEILEEALEMRRSKKVRDSERFLNQLVMSSNDQQIELFIQSLQDQALTMPNLGYCRVGGENGTKLTRAAFAFLIKQAGLIDDVNRMAYEQDESQKALMVHHWIIASKMRIWFNHKKQEIVTRLFSDTAEADTELNIIVENVISKARLLMRLAQPANLTQAEQSVLDYLQSPIAFNQIHQHLQITYHNAIRRLAAFQLLEVFIKPAHADVNVDGIIIDLLGDLQGDLFKNARLPHFATGIEDCGNHLKEKVRHSFFGILSNIKGGLGRRPRALEWNFDGQDQQYLFDKFKILNILKNDGKPTLHQLVAVKVPVDFNKDRIFKNVFITMLAQPHLGLLENAYHNMFSYMERVLDFHALLFDQRILKMKLNANMKDVIESLQKEQIDPEIITGEVAEQIEEKRRMLMLTFFDSNCKELYDLLSLLQLHINVSQEENQKSQEILPTLITPVRLTILLRLLQIRGAVNEKLKIVKILDGLRINKIIDSCLFDEVAKAIFIDNKLFFSRHFQSPYCKLIYAEAVNMLSNMNHENKRIQSGIWLNRSNYAVCRQLLRLVLACLDKNEIDSALHVCLTRLSEICWIEQTILFDVLGASISYVSTGDLAIVSRKAFPLQSKLYSNVPREVVQRVDNHLLLKDSRPLIYDQDQCREQKFFLQNLQPAMLTSEPIKLSQEMQNKLIQYLVDSEESGISTKVRIYITKHLLKSHGNSRGEIDKQVLVSLVEELNQQVSQDGVDETIKMLKQELSRPVTELQLKTSLTTNAVEQYLAAAMRHQIDYLDGTFQQMKSRKEKKQNPSRMQLVVQEAESNKIQDSEQESPKHKEKPGRRNLIKNLHMIARKEKQLLNTLPVEKLKEWLPDRCELVAWAQVWYTALDTDTKRMKALDLIQKSMKVIFSDIERKLVPLEVKNFRRLALEQIMHTQSTNLVELQKLIMQQDLVRFDQMLMEIDANTKKSSDFGRGVLEPSAIQAREKKPIRMSRSIQMITNKFSLDNNVAAKQVMLMEDLLLSHLTKRLYLELSASEQLQDENLSTNELNKLLDIWRASQREKRDSGNGDRRKNDQRCINDWQDLPSGFETTLITALLDRFSKTHEESVFMEFISDFMKAGSLQSQLILLNGKFTEEQVYLSRIESKLLTVMASWLLREKPLARIMLELIQAILLNLQCIKSAHNNHEEQRSLLALYKLLRNLNKSDMMQILKLPSLLTILSDLPEEADEIDTLAQYKLGEICIYIHDELMEPDLKSEFAKTKGGRLALSLGKMKKTLRDGLKYDDEALEKLVQEAESNVFQVTLPAQSTEWQQIDVKNSSSEMVKLILSQENEDGFCPAQGLQIFAAISDKPEITETSNIVAFNSYNPEGQVLEVKRPSSGIFYVKYPLDRNYVFQVLYSTDKSGQQALRCIDTPWDNSFNPTRLVLSFMDNYGLIIGDDELQFCKVLACQEIPMNWCFSPESVYKFQIKVPNGEKVKQTTHMSLRILLSSLEYVMVALMESGRLFVIGARSALIQTEVQVAQMGLPSKIVGMSDFFHYVWCADGQIYEIEEKNQSKRFKVVSNHELEDGSRIADVHEIVMRQDMTAAYARVTTTKGDQVVLSVRIVANNKPTIGRKEETYPACKFHMLNYDYQRVRFTSISCFKQADVAIDEDGEVWYIGGNLIKSAKFNPIQLKHNWKEFQEELHIDRPICSNLMRRSGKVALKIFSGNKRISIIQKDIESGKIGVLMLQSYNTPAETEHIDLIHNILGDTLDQYEIIDLVNGLHQTRSTDQLYVLCQPRVSTFRTKLNIGVQPILDLTPVRETQTVFAAELIEKIVTCMKKPLNDFVAEKRMTLIQRQSLSKTFFKLLEKEGIFQNDKMLSYHAQQYLSVQQALFDSIYLYCLISEDHDLNKWPVQQALLADYYTSNSLTSHELFGRLRISIVLDYKMSAGTQQYNISINRLKAQDFQTKMRQERPNEVQTLFTQFMFSCMEEGFRLMDSFNKYPFMCEFFAERSYDFGGPMRDVISAICDELMSELLPLLRPTANNQSNLEPDTDSYQINERTKEPHNLQKYKFLGYLLGWSLISIGSLNLEFPKAFWSRLVNGRDYVFTVDDLRSQDALMAANLSRISEAATQMNDQDFAAAYGDTTFVLDGHDDAQVELCPNAHSRKLKRDNASEYITLYLQAYTSLDAVQFHVLYEAFEDVATIKVLTLLTPQVAKRRICSTPIIDLAALKASTKINITCGDNLTDEEKEMAKKMLWEVIEEFSNQDRQLMLKFMTGRTRLQPGVEQEITIRDIEEDEHETDTRLPEGQTCSNEMQIVNYSSKEVLKRQLLIAFHFCGDVDADGSYLGLSDDDLQLNGDDLKDADLACVQQDEITTMELNEAHKRTETARFERRNAFKQTIVDKEGNMVEEKPKEVKEVDETGAMQDF